ncbi:MAG TPA: hypothetical protein VNM92_02615 [Thermoanaerobaculia bacterium]|nr:hypothetical protein [Thermoanaerobaculia bacterium]
MADNKKESTSEFNGFVRDIGVRAFDKLAEKLSDRQSEAGASALKETATNAAQRLASYWGTMDSSEKDAFFDQVIAAATLVVASAPSIVVGMKKGGAAKKAPAKSARTLDDAEATLPLEKKKKKKSNKDKGKKKKASDKDGKKDHKKS